MIQIGYAGEVNARYQDINVKDLIDLFPGCTPSLIHKRHGDTEGAPVVTTLTGNMLRWTFSEYDAAKPGYGVAQIIMANSSGTVIGKSGLIDTYCGTSIENGSGSVSAIVPWFNQISAINANVTEKEASAKTYSESAGSSATAASSAKTAAETAKTAAESAQAAATIAKNGAVSAKEAAAASATSAAGSASAAAESASVAGAKLDELKAGIANGSFKGDKGDTGDPGISMSVEGDTLVLTANGGD